MRKRARFFVTMGLVAASGAGCSTIAGIEDLSLTSSPDAAGDVIESGSDATMDSSGSSSGGSADSGSDGRDSGSSDGDGGACQGTCVPNATQACNTYGTQSCTPTCSWGSCSCGAAAQCMPASTRCSGVDVETCDDCGQWGIATTCSSGACTGGVCTGSCTTGDKQCSGNGVETCVAGTWGTPVACGSHQICAGSACVGTDCPGSYLLCDGFESDAIDTSKWYQPAPNDGNQSITVDGTNPHLGSYSLHVHVNAVGGGPYLQSVLRETSTFASTPVFLRAWWSMSNLHGGSGDVLIGIASNANSQSASGQLTVQNNGDLGSGVGNTLMNMNDWGLTSATTMPVGAPPSPVWTCLELEIDTSYATPNPNGLWMVWKDTDSVGSPVSDLTDTAELQPLISASFGLQFTPPSTSAVDLYIDDVAVSNSFIPCSQ